MDARLTRRLSRSKRGYHPGMKGTAASPGMRLPYRLPCMLQGCHRKGIHSVCSIDWSEGSSQHCVHRSLKLNGNVTYKPASPLAFPFLSHPASPAPITSRCGRCSVAQWTVSAPQRQPGGRARHLSLRCRLVGSSSETRGRDGAAADPSGCSQVRRHRAPGGGAGGAQEVRTDGWAYGCTAGSWSRTADL